MSIFKPKTAHVVTDTTEPPVSQVLTAWTQSGPTTQGAAVLQCDQYPGQAFKAGVSADGLRYVWSLPCGTNLGWGGNLTIDGVPGYARFSSRVVLTKDGPQQDGAGAPPAGNVNLVAAGAGWPVNPSRDEACAVYIGFQGVTVHTQEFGTFPAFGPETSSLNIENGDLQGYFDQMKALGYSHVEFAVSWNYRSQTYQYPVPGRDLSQNLPELKRRVEMAIRSGFKVALFCAGDGESVNADPQPGQYNDPAGWTYGRQWLLNNFQRIYEAMGPTPESAHDCRPFMVFLPGYDGTDSYAWVTPENLVNWWTYARGVIDAGGAGYLGQEWSAGHCQAGGQWDGDATYVNGPGRALDVILQEFPWGPPMPTNDPDAVWQICGRMLSPYVRPADQPAHDDPNPPYYLRQGTPRGPYTYVRYEYDTYGWVRGLISADGVQRDRDYLARLGPGIVC